MVDSGLLANNLLTGLNINIHRMTETATSWKLPVGQFSPKDKGRYELEATCMLR